MNRVELRERLIAAGLGRLADELLALAKDCIGLRRERADAWTVPFGASKLGGAPDLPAGERWPERNGKPYSFITQINFAEAKPFDPSGLLPGHGMLYVFIDLFTWEWWDGGSLVLYRDVPADQLRRAPMPRVLLAATPSDSYLDAFHFPDARVSFKRDISLRTQFSKLIRWQEWSAEEANAYFELEFSIREARRPNHRLLGNPSGIQYDASDAEPADWLLLLQLDWDTDMGWGWGDGGFYGVWLQEDALPRLAFDDAKYDFQTS